MICENINELKKVLTGKVIIQKDIPDTAPTPAAPVQSAKPFTLLTVPDVVILDEAALRGDLIDTLIFSAVFSPCAETTLASRWLIRRCAAVLGAMPASIQGLYEAMGAGAISGFTVPAINIRTLTYDFARAILAAVLEQKVGAVIFEIARSEIDYTKQRPDEYAVAVLAAAIKTGFKGAIFLQGDHFQLSASKYAQDSTKELKAVKDLIWEALDAGFYNIDIDTSTLVDLSKSGVKEQQRLNFSLAAELTMLVRDLEPAGVTVSIGGEIGEVGGKNSTVEELHIFMDGYRAELDKYDKDIKGISKISVQTGTSHGGVPMPDGRIAKVKLDFDTLSAISLACRAEYGLSGAVQHGASTLPDEAFDGFPACHTAEVHLATGFQNIIYDSPHLPAELKAKIYDYLKTELKNEHQTGDTQEQFIYKTRKKGFAPFKRDLWELPPAQRAGIREELKAQFAFLFGKLKVVGSAELVERQVRLVDVPQPLPKALEE